MTQSVRSRPLSIPERHLAQFAEDHDHLGSAVSPRHLAGPGDPRHITHALRAAGWHTESDPLHPKVTLHSPDDSHHLTLAPKPGSPFRPWWRIRSPHGPDHWSAEFSAAAPVEIIAGLTDALVQPALEHLHSPWELLSARGWSYHRQSGGSESATSPDKAVSMEWQISPISGPLGWAIEAVDRHNLDRPGLLWRANLDDNTPSHLVAAFTAALVAPEPVLRGRYEIPYGPPLKQEREEPVGPKAAAVHAERLAQARRHRPRKPRPTAGSPVPPALPLTSSPARPAR
ncbi:DUF317 domain-containing protein [Streptomyces sp. NRRL S-448]|uniref:DUF317 domain-containing protein n=1 Tax=Streptomyces sp. NRRL S-448 TaxID=1463907 RepID=UPI000AB52585